MKFRLKKTLYGYEIQTKEKNEKWSTLVTDLGDIDSGLPSLNGLTPEKWFEVVKIIIKYWGSK